MRLIGFCLACLLAIAGDGLAKGKRYSIEGIRIEAKVLRDGSLRIVEERSYLFHGQFRWADYSLSLNKLGRVTDFELTENGQRYEPATDQSPGSYQMSQDQDHFYVRWYYRARDESRTFRLSYRVTDAIVVYEDVAELYYKFVSEQNQKSIAAVDVTVELPQPADTSRVRAWAHGPLHGQLAFENGAIRLWVQPLPSRTWWEVRTIFPREWGPEASKRIEALARDRILTEERVLAEQANAQRLKRQQQQALRENYRGQAMELSIIVVLAGVIALITLYHRFGRAYPVTGIGRYVSDIPSDVPPAVANYIYLAGQLGSEALVGTLFDLARRGFLTVQETVQKTRSLFGPSHRVKYRLDLNRDYFHQHQADLMPYERDMIEFLFDKLGKGSDQIDFDAIKDARTQVMRWFGRWKGLVKQAWGQRPLYDRVSIKGTIFAVAVALVVIAAGIVIATYFGSPGAIAIIGGIVLLGLSFGVLRFTPEVKQLRSKLEGVRKYLSRHHFRTEATQIAGSIEQYLVYGIALGLGGKVLRELLSGVPSGQQAGYFAWYGAAAGDGSSGHFATAVSAMVSATSATLSSAAGIGGGAAAGGGAGAGGASGGAG